MTKMGQTRPYQALAARADSVSEADIAPLLGEAIDRISHEKSVSILFD